MTFINAPFHGMFDPDSHPWLDHVIDTLLFNREWPQHTVALDEAFDNLTDTILHEGSLPRITLQQTW